MKDYLGDGLYAEWDGWQVRLFCDRGSGGTHEVFLEPETMSSLFRFVERVYGKKIAVTDRGDAE